LKAIVYTKYGSTDVLHLAEVEKPIPKENEVLVKIYASSINSWDWGQLRGKELITRILAGLFKPRRKILGCDISGRVEEVGKNVKDFQPGDEVFGDIAAAGFGGFAEYVAVPEKFLAKKSPAMSFEQSAALPQVGLLALQGLRHKGSIQSGQQLLINGAGGGVGTLALQYAKSLGAEVTCVDSTEKFDLLRSLGADHLIDYKKEDYTQDGRQYDRILDVIALRTVSDYKRALKPGGIFVMLGGSMNGWYILHILFGSIFSRFGNKKICLMGYKPNRKDLEFLNQLFEEGKAVPIIDKCYPLEDVPAAFQYFGEAHHKGKIVIAIATGLQ
jgi:NADPH:quinone reductase-like Zn-dependent oxidoreductase